ncbi:MAG TPA: hypothetical protein VG032_12265 [Acidimicrobiales bacterium]|jgi:hypothetical protein|nr:hypothetical protein [Acidimicrobiales bacterium]
MKYTLTEDSFSTKEEALAEIASRGWHALEYELPAQEDELHWHDYDSVTFVLEGVCRIVFADGSAMEGGPGTWIEQPSRVIHRSGNSAYHAVFGFSVSLEDMSQPICKPVADLEADRLRAEGIRNYR